MYQQGCWYIELKRLFVVVLGVESLNFENLNLKTWTNKTKIICTGRNYERTVRNYFNVSTLEILGGVFFKFVQSKAICFTLPQDSFC